VGTPIKTEHPDEIFICCDWISADLRAAAALSGDGELSDTYAKSDPYTILSEMLDIPREECKLAFFGVIYSLDVESPILDLFPVFKEWMKGQLASLAKNGYLNTPLGRRFKLGKRDEKSVFNAVLQGTVAHAMQSSLARMYDRLQDFLIAETHDSIILAAKRPLVPKVINEAVDIMLRPLKELPKFPLRVYIGKKWKQWKLYRDYR
jgi:DNA polymerase I-like protein with 3'-5' exonuclease and polymerase domains